MAPDYLTWVGLPETSWAQSWRNGTTPAGVLGNSILSKLDCCTQTASWKPHSFSYKCPLCAQIGPFCLSHSPRRFRVSICGQTQTPTSRFSLLDEGHVSQTAPNWHWTLSQGRSVSFRSEYVMHTHTHTRTGRERKREENRENQSPLSTK